jgi:hypothetical protein
VAHDLDRQPGVREQDSAGHRVGDLGEFEGAVLATAVSGVVCDVHGRDVRPGQPDQLPVQLGPIALHNEHVVRAAAVQVAGVLVLCVECVGGDDRIGDDRPGPAAG